jgi:hypothetical protein
MQGGETRIGFMNQSNKAGCMYILEINSHERGRGRGIG